MNYSKYFPNGWYETFVIRQKKSPDIEFEINHADIYTMNTILTNYFHGQYIPSVARDIIRLNDHSDRKLLTHPIPVQQDLGNNYVNYLKDIESMINSKVYLNDTRTDDINYFGNNPAKDFTKEEELWEKEKKPKIIIPQKTDDHTGYEFNLTDYVNNIKFNVDQKKAFEDYYNKIVETIEEIKKLYNTNKTEFTKRRKELYDLTIELKKLDNLKEIDFVTENNLNKIGCEIYELGIDIDNSSGFPVYTSYKIFDKYYGNNSELYFERRPSGKFMFKTYKPDPECKNYEPVDWYKDPLFGTGDLITKDESTEWCSRPVITGSLPELHPHCVIFFAPYKKYEDKYNIYTIVDHNKLIEYCKKPELYKSYPLVDPERCEIILGTDLEVQPFIILANNRYLFDLIIKTHTETRIFVCHYNNFYWWNSLGNNFPGRLIIKELDPKIYANLFNQI